MDLKNILGNIGCAALGTIAPPFGGMAANMIKDALNLDSKATQAEIEHAVQNATPEQVLALKQADNAFLTNLKELDVDILKIDKDDRNSARKMQMKTSSKIPAVISIFITLGFFGTLYIMITEGLPEGGQRDALLIMLGALGASFTQVVNFWLGSSNGSKQKTDLMGK